MKKLLYIFLGLGLMFACSSDSDENGSNNQSCDNQPSLQTNQTTEISINYDGISSQATLNGMITNIPIGPDCEIYPVSNQGFVYSTDVQPTVEDNVANANGENVSVTVDNLISNTAYYVRTYLTNTLGTFYGNEISFVSFDASPIYIDDNGVTIKAREWAEIGDTAIINGEVCTVVDYPLMAELFAENWSTGGVPPLVCTTRITSYQSQLMGAFPDNDAWRQLESWDMSNVVQAAYLFFYTDFYGDDPLDLSFWDMSNVTNMTNMFASSDNYPGFSNNYPIIENWDVSNVNDMSYMFVGGIGDFNQDLSGWDVANVTNCTAFYNVNTGWTLPQPNFTNCNPD
jgi:surface protein